MSNLLDLNRFFVKQKGKLIELTAEYAILDEQGVQVGAVRQEGQTKMRKVLRLVSSLDQYLTHQYSIYDAAGQKVAGLVRPAKIMKSKVNVVDGQGNPVGRIQQQNVIGKIRFGLIGNDEAPLGAINGENWRAWNFQIVDASGGEIGRITKQWRGVAAEMFTTADTYMVEIEPTITGALRTLALSAAIGVDAALKQDARGFN